MKDKQQSYFVNIGSSSLLVIFLVLCLVTFAILSLSSARSDRTFSEKMAAHKQDYYEASGRAEVIVGGIDEILYGIANGDNLSGQSETAEAGTADGSYEAYLAAAQTALSGTEIEGILLKPEEDDRISFQVPAGDGQALQVVLQITDYREQPQYYEVLSWKIINTGSWESDQPLNLMPIIQ